MTLKLNNDLTKKRPQNQGFTWVKCISSYNLTNVNVVWVIKIADLGQTLVR